MALFRRGGFGKRRASLAGEALAGINIDQDGPVNRSDFCKEIQSNRDASRALFTLLILISILFGYGLGWSTDTLFSASETRLMLVDKKGKLSQWTLRNAVLRKDLTSTWAEVDQTGRVQSGILNDIAWINPGAIIGAIIAGILAAIWVLVARLFGHRILLAPMGAKPASKHDERTLHNVVEETVIAAGLPKPRVGIVENKALNAFAAGMTPDNATICVTRGLLSVLDRDELQGVIAHEVSHILNDDIRYATYVSLIVGQIALTCDFLKFIVAAASYNRHSERHRKDFLLILRPPQLLAILVLAAVLIVAPISAKLVQMAISRKREYLADATAVRLTRNPLGLIGALRKIKETPERLLSANRAMQHLYIANPFRDFDARVSALLATHPPLEDRISRLRRMS